MVSASPPSDAPPEPFLRENPAWRGRLVVAGRVALAAVGGYAVAALADALGAVALPLSRPEAVSAANMASFAVMAGAVVFVFATTTLRRAAFGIGGAAAFLALCLWFAGAFTGGAPT